VDIPVVLSTPEKWMKEGERKDEGKGGYMRDNSGLDRSGGRG
jgi:hypothetical protein